MSQSPAAIELRVGDRVVTPNLGAGIVQEPPWLMPHHHLIQFDDGRLLWVVRDAIDREVVPAASRSKKTRKRKAS